MTGRRMMMSINAAYLELARNGVVRCGGWTVKVVPFSSGYILQVTSPRGRRTLLADTYREGRAGLGLVHLIAQAAVRRLHREAG